MSGWFDDKRTNTAREAISAARNRLRVTITKHRFDLTATCTRCKAKHTTNLPDDATSWAEQHECQP